MNKVRALSENHAKVSNTLLGWNCAAPSDVTFPQRMSVDKARKELQSVIDNFFSDPKTTIVKAPCGIGKSTYTAKILADTNLKVLYS
jgi:superfamily II DNA or RNA helicase